jgi:hypothetical protein
MVPTSTHWFPCAHFGLADRVLHAECSTMNTVKVDDARRVQLPMLKPGDYYAPEMHGDDEIVLRKVIPRHRKRTKEEILSAMDQSPVNFTVSWDALKEEVR